MRSLNVFQLFILWFAFGLLSLVILRVVKPVSVEPQAWQPQQDDGRVGLWKQNSVLQLATPERTDLTEQHDTVAVDSFGRRYAGLHDGRIVRWSTDGEVKTFAQLLGRPQGMTFDLFDNLYVVEENAGKLWKIAPNKQVEQFPTANNSKLGYLNDVTVAANGTVYVTSSSSKWRSQHSNLAIFEHHNDGAIYVWREKKPPEVLVSGLAFPSGIALSHDQQSLLFTETSEYRISRVWLSGKLKGKTEVVVDNLPGFPTDITPAEDGKNYWATLFDYRSSRPLVDKLAGHTWVRRLMLNFPISWFPDVTGSPAVFLLNNKEVVKTFQAPAHAKMHGLNSVVQIGDTLIVNTNRNVQHPNISPVHRLSVSKALQTR